MKLYKVKSNKAEVLKKWGEFLNNNKDEMIKLLEIENCPREFFYLFELNNQSYAVIHMEGGPFNPPSENDINKKHREILKECLEPESINLETIYDFKLN